MLLLAGALLPALLARADAVDEYVQKQMRQLRLPGVAVAIVQAGQPRTAAFAASFQFTDTLVRQEGRWRVAASHISRLKPAS